MKKENNIIELNNGFKEAKQYHDMMTKQEDDRIKLLGFKLILGFCVVIFLFGVFWGAFGAWAFGN